MSNIDYAGYYSGHSGDTYPKELSQDKIWDNGEWKTIISPDHNHGYHDNNVNWYTYNDDTLKIQRIVGLLDKMIMGMEHAIPIKKMNDIKKDLIALKDDMLNYWPSFGSSHCPDENEEKEEQKIELEEDLFEL